MKIELDDSEAVQIVPLEYHRDECPIDVIRMEIAMTERLTQLAEEAAELAQAALKLRRTMINESPTPVTRHEAEEKLLEEIADVKLCLHVCGYENVRDKIKVNRIISQKAERWLQRLTEKTDRVTNRFGSTGV